jgi:hypothetical protein
MTERRWKGNKEWGRKDRKQEDADRNLNGQNARLAIEEGLEEWNDNDWVDLLVDEWCVDMTVIAPRNPETINYD